MNPYKNLPSHQFWSRAMTAPRFTDIDPVVESTFRIGLDDKVATLGSCFAQHVARHLKRSGLNYFVPEDGGELGLIEADRLGFGVFSARYGNVYTVAQAVQLFDRAFGSFVPQDSVWALADRFVDAFRPQVQPGGFENVEAVEADRVGHLAAVRRVFSEAHVIVLTLGLTEGWRSKIDGAVYPVAPGVSGGSFDPSRYSFVNFSVTEVAADLVAFCERIGSVNPAVKILLTVSPVPLIATYEPRHVLVSTILSKSILRVAADEAVKRLKFVNYFPSFEIITAPGNNYFESDLRQVSEFGVQHVMRAFSAHYIYVNAPRTNVKALIEAAKPIICDEEAIEAARAPHMFG